MHPLLSVLLSVPGGARQQQAGFEPPDIEAVLRQLQSEIPPEPEVLTPPPLRPDPNINFDRGPCKSPAALADERTDAWSHFYVVRDVCVSGRTRCGTQPSNGFGDNDAVFNPLSVFERWLDFYERSCPELPKDARQEAFGLAFVVQHVDTFFPFNIGHQADSLLSLYSDMQLRPHVEQRLAKASTVLMPQFANSSGLQTEWPWLVDMLKIVLPNKPDGSERQLRACDELANRPPICFDELVIHRQVGPWINTGGRANRELDYQDARQRRVDQPQAVVPEVHRTYFPSIDFARSFHTRAAEVLQLETCPGLGHWLTLTLVVRRDARGYANWEEIINKTAAVVEAHKPWTLNVWEANSEPESLAKQAARLACTDLLVSVHGAQATNMIFMPPTSGMIYAARCGCTQTSGFMKAMADQIGLRWWDELEDCEPWQDGTCVSINEVGNSSNYTADFDSNWEKPISRALNYMRVSASSRRPAWDGEQPKILDSDPKAVAAVREQRIAAGMRGDGGPPAEGLSARAVARSAAPVPSCVSLDASSATDEWCSQTCLTSVCPTSLCKCAGSWLSRVEPVASRRSR